MKTPLKLKIQLLDLPIKIVRKILVSDDISLYQFHVLIQAAMGWWDAHLYSFSDSRNKGTIGIPSDYDLEYEDLGYPPIRDGEKASLKEVFLQENIGRPFYYLYDFGDYWEHRITFQKVTKKDSKNFIGFPTCLEAQGKCPPEDVGGVHGYMEFINIVQDRKDPEYWETIEWAGIDPSEEYDENKVDIEEINRRIMDAHFNNLS